MPRIFISHAVRDGAQLASDLTDKLEAAGRECWIAPRNVTPGATYPSEIMAALRACEAVVLILTSGANASADVLQEVKIAHSQGKPIIPVIVGGMVPSDDLAYFLAVRHHIPWSSAAAIAAQVARAVPRSAPAPSPPPSGVLDPLATIAAAAADVAGVSGSFSLDVKSAALEGDVAWLCSELDYRDPRCLSVRLTGHARSQCLTRHAAEPTDLFMGKRIVVTGMARKRRIDFVSNGAPTGHYYFQTHVDVDAIEQIVIV